MDKELLFKPRLPEVEIDVEGVGTIRVRALSRAEALAAQNAKGVEAMERKILVLGMVDPQVTDADVRKWQDASVAGEIEAVTNCICELSGLSVDNAALKEAMRSFRDEPDT